MATDDDDDVLGRQEFGPKSHKTLCFEGFRVVRMEQRCPKPYGFVPIPGLFVLSGEHHGLNTYKSLCETRKTRCFTGPAETLSNTVYYRHPGDEYVFNMMKMM